MPLTLLMSYIHGAPCKARNFNVVYIYIYIYIYMDSLRRPGPTKGCRANDDDDDDIYGLTFGNAKSIIFLFVAQCFNIESMQKVLLCQICV
jgi:hypothetical protein